MYKFVSNFFTIASERYIPLLKKIIRWFGSEKFTRLILKQDVVIKGHLSKVVRQRPERIEIWWSKVRRTGWMCHKIPTAFFLGGRFYDVRNMKASVIIFPVLYIASPYTFITTIAFIRKILRELFIYLTWMSIFNLVVKVNELSFAIWRQALFLSDTRVDIS